jgi:DNA-binding MarR family transcriptional regulator
MKDSENIHAKAYFNLVKTNSWIETKVKAALKEFGITHAQLNVLYILNEKHPDPVSANELKAKILVSNPDTTRLLDRLVKKGYVARETCPKNRRKIDISLTNEGLELYDKAHASTKNSVGNYLEKYISREEAVELRRILHKIIK